MTAQDTEHHFTLLARVLTDSCGGRGGGRPEQFEGLLVDMLQQVSHIKLTLLWIVVNVLKYVLFWSVSCNNTFRPNRVSSPLRIKL